MLFKDITMKLINYEIGDQSNRRHRKLIESYLPKDYANNLKYVGKYFDYFIDKSGLALTCEPLIKMTEDIELSNDSKFITHSEFMELINDGYRYIIATFDDDEGDEYALYYDVSITEEDNEYKALVKFINILEEKYLYGNDEDFEDTDEIQIQIFNPDTNTMIDFGIIEMDHKYGEDRHATMIKYLSELNPDIATHIK